MKNAHSHSGRQADNSATTVPATKGAPLPILKIDAHSEAEKTALIAALLPLLLRHQLRVAVVGQDDGKLVEGAAHMGNSRFFQAGADVFTLAHDAVSSPSFFQRSCLHGVGSNPMENIGFQLARLTNQYDLVLVTGRVQMPLPSLWLLAEDAIEPPDECGPEAVLAVFLHGEERTERVCTFILQWLGELLHQSPVWACILIGGRSSRMGRPKHLLTQEEKTNSISWLEQTVDLLQPLIGNSIALSGAGLVPESLAALPRLPDVPEARGPLTGILAAMRWQPSVSWLLLACDMPHISSEALNWLLSCRQPGSWGVVPRLQEGGFVEPLLAHYDSRCATLFEQLLSSGSLRIGQIAGQSKIATPLVPHHLRQSWLNINTPEELAVSRHTKGREERL